FFFSSRRRHTRFSRDWSADVCSSDLESARTTPCTGLHGRGSRRRSFGPGAAARQALDARPRTPVDNAQRPFDVGDTPLVPGALRTAPPLCQHLYRVLGWVAAAVMYQHCRGFDGCVTAV